MSLEPGNVWEAARVFAGTAHLLDSMPLGGRVALLGDVGATRELAELLCQPAEIHLGSSALLMMFEDQHFGWALCAEADADAAEVMRVSNVAIFRYAGGSRRSVDALVARGWTLVIGAALQGDAVDVVVARRPASDLGDVVDVPPGLFELDAVLEELEAQAD